MFHLSKNYLENCFQQTFNVLLQYYRKQFKQKLVGPSDFVDYMIKTDKVLTHAILGALMFDINVHMSNSKRMAIF